MIGFDNVAEYGSVRTVSRLHVGGRAWQRNGHGNDLCRRLKVSAVARAQRIAARRYCYCRHSLQSQVGRVPSSPTTCGSTKSRPWTAPAVLFVCTRFTRILGRWIRNPAPHIASGVVAVLQFVVHKSLQNSRVCGFMVLSIQALTKRTASRPQVSVERIHHVVLRCHFVGGRSKVKQHRNRAGGVGECIWFATTIVPRDKKYEE